MKTPSTATAMWTECVLSVPSQSEEMTASTVTKLTSMFGWEEATLQKIHTASMRSQNERTLYLF